MWHYHTNIFWVLFRVKLKWSAGHCTSHCSCQTVCQNRVNYSYEVWFPTTVSNMWCTWLQYLLLCILKWHQGGSVMDNKPQGHPCSLSKPNNVERVRETILWSRHRSVQNQALAAEFGQLCTEICITIPQNPSCPGTQWTGQGELTSAFQPILEQEQQHCELTTDVRWGPLPHVSLCE
jgi:hypothetical protein